MPELTFKQLSEFLLAKPRPPSWQSLRGWQKRDYFHSFKTFVYAFSPLQCLILLSCKYVRVFLAKPRSLIWQSWTGRQRRHHSCFIVYSSSHTLLLPAVCLVLFPSWCVKFFSAKPRCPSRHLLKGWQTTANFGFFQASMYVSLI